MGINNFNYHYYGNKIHQNFKQTPSFKGKVEDEDFKKKLDAIINSRKDLLFSKENLEKITNPENISVLECLATQKYANGYDRYQTGNIISILQYTNEDNANTIISLAEKKNKNDYTFNSIEMQEIASILNKDNCSLAEKIVEERQDITSFYLRDLITIPNINEELLFKFLNSKEQDKHKYDLFYISDIAPYLKEENKELIHSFIENTKNSADNGITGLTEIFKKSNKFQRQYAIELLNKRDNLEKPIFDTFSISNIIPYITPENIETVKKFVDWTDENKKNLFSPMYLEDLIKSDKLFIYEDLISKIIEKHNNKTTSILKTGDRIGLALSGSIEDINKGIEEIGEENLLKLPIDELSTAFREGWNNDEAYERGIKNLKILKENTPKEIWENLDSVSVFSYYEVLSPEFVAERMGYLKNFPDHIVKRMDANIMGILLSDEFRPEDYQISQEAIKYFEGTNPQILDKIPAETILALILVPEEAHSIKDGLDFLCGLPPEILENCKSLINAILYIPGNMLDEGYNFNKKSAEELLDILSKELSPELFEGLNHVNLTEALISYDNVIDKETLLRNISFLNKLTDEEIPANTYSIGKILKADKNVNLEKNKELAEELTSYENFAKLIKKYKGSDLEKLLKDMFEIKGDNSNFYGFEYDKRNRDISLLMTNETLDENTYTKAFEAFAKTVKMANRELIKIDPETQQISYNFLNGNDYRTKEEARKNLNQKFKENFINIINALAITDAGTINNLLNRRFNQFISQVEIINNLHPEDKKILSTLIKDCGILNANNKVVTVPDRDKIDFITLLRSNRRLIASGGSGINFNDYLQDTAGYQVENKNIKKIIDVKTLKKDILKKALLNSGISEQEIEKISLENLKWDTDYTHLLFAKPPRDKGELATVIKESTLGRFANFITDETNEHGIANENTENAFYEAGINFDVWDKKEAQDLKVSTTIGRENINIKLWNRDPQESLFDGSYTTCCTALDAGNGASMARYLLNKSFNVVELKNDKGKTFAMSRIYMANIEDKPSLIMENLEINNNWLENLTDEDKKQLKDSIVEYMKKFANELGENEVPIYFSTSYNKLESFWSSEHNTVEKEIAFIGDVSPKDIYMNTFKGYTKPVGQKIKAQFYEIK